jgi:hypothetical protein
MQSVMTIMRMSNIVVASLIASDFVPVIHPPCQNLVPIHRNPIPSLRAYSTLEVARQREVEVVRQPEVPTLHQAVTVIRVVTLKCEVAMLENIPTRPNNLPEQRPPSSFVAALEATLLDDR